MTQAEMDGAIEKVLDKYAAYCDSNNREIEYDTSDNIDFDEAKQQINQLIADAVVTELQKIEEGIGNTPKSVMYRDYETGSLITIDRRIKQLQLLQFGEAPLALFKSKETK